MTKTIIWAELTVPREDLISHAQDRKSARYTKDTDKRPSLQTMCLRNKWNVHPFTIEVGNLGFVATSVRHFLKRLGFDNAQIKFMLHCQQSSQPLLISHLEQSV